MNARTDLESAPRIVSAKGDGDGGPRHSVDLSSTGVRAVPGSARSYCHDYARGKQPGRTRHTSTAIGNPRRDEGFSGMPQASLPARTVISEVVANDE